MDILIVLLYLVAMIGFGIWGRFKARNQEEFLVAGRRLGPLLYAGTLSAVVLGGASTIGGVGLGYEFGISGMWLVFAIGLGICALSLFFAGRIQKLEIYTVSQMLQLRYGAGSRLVSGTVMMIYALLLSVTSTVAYGAIFSVLFDMSRVWAILLGGGVVIIYSMLGGMWSITLTDFVQFIIQTVGIFLILLPVVVIAAGGFGGMQAELDASYFSLTGIGGDTIVTYLVIYGFGLLIGQDIWQRVFTSRSPGVARWAGLGAGVYCLLYGVAGALVGTAAQVILPGITVRDDVFPAIVQNVMNPVLGGFVLAAALAAVMSTSSGTLIAAATVTQKDIVGTLLGRGQKHRLGDLVAPEPAEAAESVNHSRFYILVFGVLMLGISLFIPDVVAALTIAYDVLVGGLLVAILGGLVWRRANIYGAITSMVAGTIGTLVTMAVVGDIFANAPIYVGLGAALVSFVVVSLLTPPTSGAVAGQWRNRLERGKQGIDCSGDVSESV